MYMLNNILNHTCLDNRLTTTPRMLTICSYAVVVLETSLVLIAMIARWKIFHSNLYIFVASTLVANLLSAIAGIVLAFLSSFNVSNRAVAFTKGINYGGIVLLNVSLCFVHTSVRFTYTRFTDFVSTSFIPLDQMKTRNYCLTRMSVLFRSKKVANRIIIVLWILFACLVILPTWMMCSVDNGFCFTHCIGHVEVYFLNGTKAILLACDERKCNMYMQPLWTSYIILLITIAFVCVLFLIWATISAVCVKIKIVPQRAKCKQTIEPTEASTTENEFEAVPEVGPTVTTKRVFGFNHDIMARFALYITTGVLICWLPILTGLASSTIFNVHLMSLDAANYLTLMAVVLQLLVPFICAVMLGGIRTAMLSFYSCTRVEVTTPGA